MAKKQDDESLQNGHLKKKPSFERMVKAFNDYYAIKSDIAKVLNISRMTLDKYLKESVELQEAYADAQENSKDIAVSNLFKRITGYEQPEDKIFIHEGIPVIVPTLKHYPPDPTSIIFYLKTQAKDRGFIEKIETELSGKTEQTISFKES